MLLLSLWPLVWLWRNAGAIASCRIGCAGAGAGEPLDQFCRARARIIPGYPSGYLVCPRPDRRVS